MTAAALSLGSAAPAGAAPLPASLYTYAAYGYDAPGGSVLNLGEGSTGDILLPPSSFSAQAALSGVPAVRARFATSGSDVWSNASATAKYDFFVSVAGGSPGPVPLIVTGTFDVEGSTYGDAWAKLTVHRSDQTYAEADPSAVMNAAAHTAECVYDNGCGRGTVAITGVNISPFTDSGAGAVGQIVLSVKANVRPMPAGSYVAGWSDAFLDPLIAVDPTFVASHPGMSFQIALNPVVGNVPEPASAVLMALGAGLLGWRRRR